MTDVMQTSMDGCWIVGPEGRFVEINDAYCELIGFRREELIGQTISFVEAVETPEVTAAHVRRVVEFGHDRFETRHRKKDGSVLDIEVSTSHLGRDSDHEHLLLVFLRDITARKRREADLRAAHDVLELHVRERTRELQAVADALQQSERRLSVALKSVDMVVFQQDRDLRYTWMVRPQLGYASDDVIGKSDLELLPPADARRIVDLKRRVLDAGEPIRAIVPVTIGGDTYYYDLAVEPIRDPEGAVVGVAGASLNLTEHVRAQRALEASEARYRVLFEKSTQAVFLTDRRTGRFVSANAAAEKLTGRSLDELVELTPRDVAPEGARERWKLMESALGPLDFGEIVFVRPDGTERPAELSVVPLGAELMIGFARDLTERKAGEDRRRTLSSAVERSPASILITDAEGNIEYVNPRFTEVTGYSAEEVLGKNPRFLRSGSTAPEEYRALWEKISAGGEWRGEFENRRKNGELFWDLASIASITDARGGIAHYVAVQEEITDRKRAEKERARVETELRQTSKMEAIGQLAGGVAHDFNNLLSIVLSYTSLLLDDLKVGDPMRADVEEIKRAGERARDLTGQLLAFGRKQMLEPRPSDLNQILAGMEKMLRRLLGEDIELSLLVAHKLGAVYADPGQIERVIMNLVVNARDATPRGGSVSIQTENVHLDAAYAADHPGVAPGRYVMMAVTDTGLGMDKETQARIFEPFFTTKEKGKGTGLGLSTVFGIVEQSGGHIGVHSEPGAWTTFKVYLPRTDRPADVLSSAPPSPGDLRGSETILLVDDDEQVRGVARAILCHQGYHVLEAQNGGEAFLICEKFASEIHLLLTDVAMPRMSGPELASRLTPMRPAMKVLYMSGYTEESIGQGSIIGAGIAFLRKPLTPDALTRKVREVLSSPRNESLSAAP